MILRLRETFNPSNEHNGIDGIKFFKEIIRNAFCFIYYDGNCPLSVDSHDVNLIYNLK